MNIRVRYAPYMVHGEHVPVFKNKRQRRPCDEHEHDPSGACAEHSRKSLAQTYEYDDHTNSNSDSDRLDTKTPKREKSAIPMAQYVTNQERTQETTDCPVAQEEVEDRSIGDRYTPLVTCHCSLHTAHAPRTARTQPLALGRARGTRGRAARQV